MVTCRIYDEVEKVPEVAENHLQHKWDLLNKENVNSDSRIIT